MDKNQKIALKLFKPREWRYMENLPEDIRISTLANADERSEFSVVDIRFDTNPIGDIFFNVRVDNDYYLCQDGKLRDEPEMAALFYKDSSKKKYPHILNRAMECVAFCLQGRFKKVSV